MHDKHQVTEEPCKSKGLRTVLKPSRGGDSLAQVNHVEKNSACIYSQLKTCSSGEVATMINGGPMKLYKIGQPWQNEHFYCQ
jgi:hypothetical protein